MIYYSGSHYYTHPTGIYLFNSLFVNNKSINNEIP